MTEKEKDLKILTMKYKEKNKLLKNCLNSQKICISDTKMILKESRTLYDIEFLNNLIEYEGYKEAELTVNDLLVGYTHAIKENSKALIDFIKTQKDIENEIKELNETIDKYKN